MIGQIVALMVVAQGGTVQPEAPPTAAKLISTMLAKYSQAQTMVGTITLTQAVGDESGQLITDIQFERPEKLFIQQVKKTGDNKKWILSATGKIFSYDEPTRQVNELGARLAESQIADGVPMTIDEVFRIAGESLGDRSFPLNVAMGAKTRLAEDRNTWASLSIKGKVKIGEVEANQIVGRWREGRFAAVSGSVEIDITNAGDLLRYVITQNLAADPKAPAKRLISTWDCALKPGSKPDQSLFKVYK